MTPEQVLASAERWFKGSRAATGHGTWRIGSIALDADARRAFNSETGSTLWLQDDGRWTGKPWTRPPDLEDTKPKPNGHDRTAKVGRQGGAQRGWRAAAQKTDAGQLVPNLYNARSALDGEPGLAGRLAFDEMAGRAVLTEGDGSRRPVTDADVIDLQCQLQHLGLTKISRDTVHDAVELVAVGHGFHPVRDYLDGLAWDGTARIDTWIIDGLGADDTAYVRTIGRLFLIAMVARIYQPGCKADYMVVLEGEQGEFKSTACRVLAGDAWFSDTLPPITHQKDAQHHLAGLWLCEVAELSSFAKAEANALKMFLSVQVDRYRPSYGRRDIHQPRTCLFVGTTNESTYLRDHTGGRRFWPVKIGAIDLDRLRADRDQLFAEAVALYSDGEPWWPNRAFERAVIAPEQEERFEDDAWDDAVAEYVSGHGRVTVGQVMSLGLRIELPKRERAGQVRVMRILERLGWQRGPRAHGGIRHWYPP